MTRKFAWCLLGLAFAPACSRPEPPPAATPAAQAAPTGPTDAAAAEPLAPLEVLLEIEEIGKNLDLARGKCLSVEAPEPVACVESLKLAIDRAATAETPEHWTKAEQVLAEISRGAADQPGLLHQKARLLLLERRAVEAQAVLDQGPSLDALAAPERAEHLALVAAVAWATGRVDEAHKSFQEAQRFDHTNAATRYGMARRALFLGDAEKAMWLQSGIDEIDALYWRPDTLVLRGDIERARNRMEMAELYHTAAQEALPGYAPAEFATDLTQWAMGKNDAVLARIEAVAPRSPSPRVWLAYAIALNQAGRKDASAEWAAKVDALCAQPEGQRLEPFLDLCVERYLRLGGDAKLARTRAEQARLISPGPESDWLLARYWLEQDQPGQAKAALERLVAAGRRAGEVHLALAQVYDRLGDAEGAARERDRAAAFGGVLPPVAP